MYQTIMKQCLTIISATILAFSVDYFLKIHEKNEFVAVHMASFVVFLNFLWLTLSNFSRYIKLSRVQIFWFVQAVFFKFFKLVFYRCRRTGQIDFPKKRTSTKIKCQLPDCHILQNFTKLKETRENSLPVLPFVLMLMS